MRLAEVVFWGSLAIAAYANGLYPFAVRCLARRIRRSSLEDGGGNPAPHPLPKVTLLITAHCEEHRIVERLENAAALDYPSSRLEIVVGCDSEDDLTGLVAKSCPDRRIKAVRFTKSSSRAELLNTCVRESEGDILVLSNAQTMMRPDAIRRLVAPFRDPAVGAVSGTVGVADGETAALSKRLEERLNRCEARLGGLPEISKGICAIRSKLFVPFPEEPAIDEFLMALAVHRQGYHVVVEESAVATVQPWIAIDQPTRAVRLRAEARHVRELLSRPTHRVAGWIAVLFWCHKVLRRITPAFLIAAFVSNACLADDPFYLHCLLLHESFYICASTVWIIAGFRRRWRSRPASVDIAPLTSMSRYRSMTS